MNPPPIATDAVKTAGRIETNPSFMRSMLKKGGGGDPCICLTPDVCSNIASFLGNSDILPFQDCILNYKYFITAKEALGLGRFEVAREAELEQFRILHETDPDPGARQPETEFDTPDPKKWQLYEEMDEYWYASR